MTYHLLNQNTKEIEDMNPINKVKESLSRRMRIYQRECIFISIYIHINILFP